MPYESSHTYTRLHRGQASNIDELVFNNDSDFSNARVNTPAKFDPSYGTLAVRRLSQHPFRRLPAFNTEEPSYPHASMPRIVADDLHLNRIQIDQTPDHHAFVTGKIGKAPHPAHFTALALSSSSRLPRVPPPGEMALARRMMPRMDTPKYDARYGPTGSRQPFGHNAGHLSNRYFGRLGNVRTGLA